MTTVVEQRVPILLDYPVVFTRGALAPTNDALVHALDRREPGRRHRVAAILDGGLVDARPDLEAALVAYATAHSARIELVACWTLPGGEAAKDGAVLASITERLAALRIDRHSFVLAIGGGAVLDVVGYAAATLHRGVRLIRMPTTVLAQNDAGIGVKNGINAFGAKNFLGTFAAPFAVINDSELLATLAPRDRIAGMAEAVKVAAIRDRVFFDWLEANAARLAAFDRDAIDHMIEQCARLHLAHIAGGGDPFETGNARPLDFGHWAAHKLELLTHHELRHGEAVAIGMAVDARYSHELGLLDEASLDRFIGLLGALALPVHHQMLGDRGLLDGLAEFREHLGGELTITVLEGLGRGVDHRDVDIAGMKRAIGWLEAHAGR